MTSEYSDGVGVNSTLSKCCAHWKLKAAKTVKTATVSVSDSAGSCSSPHHRGRFYFEHCALNLQAEASNHAQGCSIAMAVCRSRAGAGCKYKGCINEEELEIEIK
jgi:hypothetical protein